MSILISPSDNRGWGTRLRRRARSAMRGVGTRRPLTLRTLLGLGATRRRRRGARRSRILGGASRRSSTTTRIVAVRTTRSRRRRR
ncbi:core protein precursor pVII [Aviadenovirus bubonis]|nr:core protein precursor pVII [Owl adenovirus]